MLFMGDVQSVSKGLVESPSHLQEKVEFVVGILEALKLMEARFFEFDDGGFDKEFEEFVKSKFHKLTDNQKEVCKKLGLSPS